MKRFEIVLAAIVAALLIFGHVEQRKSLEALKKELSDLSAQESKKKKQLQTTLEELEFTTAYTAIQYELDTVAENVRFPTEEFVQPLKDAITEYGRVLGNVRSYGYRGVCINYSFGRFENVDSYNDWLEKERQDYEDFIGVTPIYNESPLIEPVFYHQALKYGTRPKKNHPLLGWHRCN